MSASYANPFPTFQRAMRIISAITNANPASVTTTFAHQYGTGDIVRLDVPLGFGMPQINQQIGTITVTSSTIFTINIDSSGFDAFSIPSSPPQQAQVVPVGEISANLAGATQNVLPYSAT